MPPLSIIHHAARRDDHAYPASSLPAVSHCLAANARIIEVDIAPMAGDDFLLAHDDDLARFTTGRGLVHKLTAEQVRDLHLTWHGDTMSYPPALLSEVLALLASHDAPVELQLDLKEHTPLSTDVLGLLLQMVRPVRDRVRVTSCADWTLRRLRAMDPELPLGFDPLFYLDYDIGPRPPEEFPRACGVFGYWDDHPLASMQWDAADAYLRERADWLWALAPAGCIWYFHGSLLARSLDDGFDWIAAWHARGVKVDAWTLGFDYPGTVELAQRLAAAGVDRITSNTPIALAKALDRDVIF